MAPTFLLGKCNVRCVGMNHNPRFASTDAVNKYLADVPARYREYGNIMLVPSPCESDKNGAHNPRPRSAPALTFASRRPRVF